jgi:hypothetical protein
VAAFSFEVPRPHAGWASLRVQGARAIAFVAHDTRPIQP